MCAAFHPLFHIFCPEKRNKNIVTHPEKRCPRYFILNGMSKKNLPLDECNGVIFVVIEIIESLCMHGHTASQSKADLAAKKLTVRWPRFKMQSVTTLTQIENQRT
jgi:hypothetical protein